MKKPLFLLSILFIAFSSCKKEPVASFELSQNNVKAPVLIEFTNTSSDASEYSWDFGDNSSSQAKDPSHMYESWGNMNVTLTATGKGGSSSLTKTLIVVPPDPTADFNMSKNKAAVGEIVSFTNLATYATSCNWNFGDGTTSSEDNPTHIYESEGNFNVSLSIIGDGGTAQISKEIEIYYPEPTANFSMSKTTAVDGELVTFTNLSEHASTYSWNFGDGSNLSPDTNPTHSYDRSGTFSVILSVTGPGGNDQVAKTIESYYNEPVASFAVNKTTVYQNENVVFTNSSIYATDYEWNFDDGNSSTAANPTHSYSNTGTYTVTLTASGKGGTNTTSSTIYVISENAFIDDFKTKDNWTMNYCTGSIVNEHLVLNPTSSTYIGYASHSFSTSQNIPWNMQVDIGLNIVESEDSYGIMIPLNSASVPAMVIIIIPSGDSYNWGLLFFYTSQGSWMMWDSSTGRGFSNQIQSDTQFRTFKLEIDNNERISLMCNEEYLLNKDNTLNNMESGLHLDLSFNISEIRLNSEASETKWDNFYFESDLGAQTIAAPSVKSTIPADISKLNTQNLQITKAIKDLFK